MDSVSQIALGAAVAVATMGRRTAVWKAALWGAVRLTRSPAPRASTVSAANTMNDTPKSGVVAEATRLQMAITNVARAAL